MFLRWRILLCVLALTSLINKSFARSSHSYPPSGGLSGNDHHNYPSSGGLSGDGYGYPSSGGNYGYPSSGGNQGYNSSVVHNGYYTPGGGYNSTGNTNVYPTSGGNNQYNSSGSRHVMPGGTSGYPSFGGKYNSSRSVHHEHSSPSGNQVNSVSKHVTSKNYNQPPKKSDEFIRTNTISVYNGYYYTPPKVIKYIPASGGNPIVYPVSQSQPPTYVYQIKDSGSKYGTLLTGLALLNLGTISSTPHVQVPESTNYITKPGEVCLFGVAKDNGDYEETKIDCQIMSSFIIHQEMQAAKMRNTSVTTTTVNSANGMPATAPNVSPVLGSVLYAMLPNGTLVPVNTSSVSSENNIITSSGTTTITTTVTNALDVKGEPLELTSGMKCYVVRTTPKSRLKKFFPCRLLQAYADKSIKRNSAARNGPAFMMIFIVFSVYFIY